MAFTIVACRRSAFSNSFAPDTRRVLEGPTQVELFEIVNEFDVSKPEYMTLLRERRLVAGYPVVRALRTNADHGRQLGTILLDNGIYHPDGQVWMCVFEPHHVAVFSRGNDRVAAVICFKCGDIEIHAGRSLEKKYPMQSFSPKGHQRMYKVISEMLPPRGPAA